MAGITTTRGLSGAQFQATSHPFCFPAFEVKPAWQGLSCEENVTFLQKISLVYTARVAESTAGFGQYHPGIGRPQAASIWHSAGLAFEPTRAAASISCTSRHPLHDFLQEKSF
jgi:hypothetical protein